MKRIAWTLLALLLFLVYYLSSIPGLKVLPVLRQINGALQAVGISSPLWPARWPPASPSSSAP